MSLEKVLLERCHSKCELCSAAGNLAPYHLLDTDKSQDKSVMVCEKCAELINDPSKDSRHWRCLSESLWSEHLPVQVMAWRLLKRLSEHDWAQDLESQIFLDEETLLWAEEATDNQIENSDPVTKDSNGAILVAGDSVTLIKDLDVKGANFTAKRGTVVKNISLTSNPAHIEGRVNGTQIVLLTCFLKKA